MIIFNWDENKNKRNIQKHSVSFDEAMSVFFDENAIIIEDILHSREEERYILLGISNKTRILVVCHCYRENDEIIRIISARKASQKEIEQYERINGYEKRIRLH